MVVDVDVLMASLVLTAVCLRMLPNACSVGVRLGVSAVVLVLSLLPWPWGGATWVLSYLSGFSISAVVLAVFFLYRCMGGLRQLPVRQVRQASVLLLVVAVVFYPLSMGVGAWDPYALGYGSRLFSGVLLGLGLLALVASNGLLCVLLILAQLAWAARLLRSDNLWDYLFDPWLVIWAAAWLVAELRLWRRAREDGVIPESAMPASLQTSADVSQEG